MPMFGVLQDAAWMLGQRQRFGAPGYCPPL